MSKEKEIKEEEFLLPTEITEEQEVDPHDLIIISTPKAGKTVITAELTKQIKPDALLFCVERGGTDYVSGVILNIWKDPKDPKRLLNIEEAIENYKKYRDALLANRGKYKYLILDNMTDLYTLAEIMGTYYYMYAVPVGKSFNRDKKTHEEYPFNSPDFRLVTTLPDGNGYQYVYKWFTDQLALFAQIAPYRIYLAHVKDTLLKKKKSGDKEEEVKGNEINLTGNLKNIVARQVATLCKLIVDEDKRYLSFEVDDSNVIAGSRVSRLTGKILISEKTKEGKIVTYWDHIFENLKEKKKD